jgi:hypothetical protein
MSELSLSEALASKRLEDFVAQAEKQGVGPAIRSDFDAMLGSITAPLQEDQTSHSPAHDLKPGK